MITPYYDQDGITIYCLNNIPMCDNISLGYCTEVESKCHYQQQRDKGDLGLGKKARMFLSCQRGRRKVINKPQSISKSGKDLAWGIILGRVMILSSNLAELEHYADMHHGLARFAIIRKLNVIIKMATQETTRQIMCVFFAGNVTWLRMEG